MPQIMVDQVASTKFLIPKAKLMDLFLTANGISPDVLKSFYYDTAQDALVFELYDVVTHPIVNYSDQNLLGP